MNQKYTWALLCLAKTKPCISYEEPHTNKHFGGSLMVWRCFAASGPERLAIIEELRINLELNHFFLCVNPINA